MIEFVRPCTMQGVAEDPARWSRSNGELGNRRSIMLVRATMTDGSQHVSEFSKLRGIRRLSGDVFGGRKAFPVWATVAEAHPVSGEPCQIRTRKLVSGRLIASLEIVDAEGASIQMVDEGAAGRITFTEDQDVPEGVQPGVDYPLHRSPDGRRFVVVFSNSGAGEQDVLHYIDDEAGVSEEVPVGVMGESDDGAPYDDEDQLS